MPPRASLTSSFSLTDSTNEVVCPLHNLDGSSCRKRCLGEKRFRSMQEHIRRAHPEYYIPKLPATKESFDLMISSPPHERPPTHDGLPTPLPTSHGHQQHADAAALSPAFHYDHHSGLGPSGFEGYHALGQHDGGYFTAGESDANAIYNSMQAQTRVLDSNSNTTFRRGSLIPAASAAAALAQLHYHRPDPDWGGQHHDMGGQVITFPILQMSPTITEADFLQNLYADPTTQDLKPAAHFHVDPALEAASSYLPSGGSVHTTTGLYDPAQTSYPTTSSSQELPSLLPSSLARSPDNTNNDVTLPPLQQRHAARPHGRPRKSSLGQLARLAKHERRKSREVAKRSSGGDRKAFSAEPSAAALYGKRWEDLIDAATSATEEEGSRDLTPIPASPFQSPQAASRTSPLPPFALGSQFQSFQASPLNRALTPPPPDLRTFASGESSLSSGLEQGGGIHRLHRGHGQHGSGDSTGSRFQIMDAGGGGGDMFGGVHDNNIGNNNSTTTNSINNNNTTTNPNPTSRRRRNPPYSTSSSNNSRDSHHTAATTQTQTQTQTQIYCAGCRRLSVLRESFACTNCICGLCRDCVEAIVSGQSRGRMSMCPRCNGMDSGFRAFQLDLRG
ncbi:hypothetical protein LTR08_000991 [Meristemomyces frigidus]|nr:hypothetical protein LTR08_000991 [Meristemomyces frigidus]